MSNSFKNKIVLIFVSILLATQGIFAQSNFAELARNNYTGSSPKYIFYFIGDGFGFAQAHVAEAYMTALEESTTSTIKRLEMNKFPFHGYFTTNALNSLITESAAAGTALATRYKTTTSTIGMNGARDSSYKSIAKMAHEKGWKVGIVTSVSIDHATPAAFYAHQPTRNMYHEISLQLSESNFEYFAGGGFVEPVKTFVFDDVITPKDANYSSPEVISSAIVVAMSKGYNFVDSREVFLGLKNGDDKIIVTSPSPVAGHSIPYTIDKARGNITLTEFTAKGIELLDNDEGFFMMIEGGKIDWACHANDAATTIKEVMQLDSAVMEAVKFYQKHPNETLIVVAGDHETGGMALGFAGTYYAKSDFALLQYQKISSENFAKLVNEYRESHKENADLEDVMRMINHYFGLGDESKNLLLTDFERERLKDAFMQSMLEKTERKKDDQAYQLYGGYDPLTVTACHILAEKAGIGWTTFSHTASPIPVRAIGVGGILFSNFLDNTDLPKNIMKLMRVEQ